MSRAGETIYLPKQFNNQIKKLEQNGNISYDTLIKIKQSNLDQIQQKTLDRIIKIRNINVTKNINTINKITKNCPHCNKSVTEASDTIYLICGYESNGYDQYGCRNDWCFQCEKKLCKNWHSHQLFNKLNRTHDSLCCKHHAIKNKNNYLSDYCMCVNNFVNR